MGLDRFDIYWIHNVTDAPHWTEELTKFYEGKDNVPLLGVSNHNLAEIKQANEILKAHGLKLSAVQNHSASSTAPPRIPVCIAKESGNGCVPIARTA